MVVTNNFKKALLNRCHVGGSRGRGSDVLVAHPRSARAHKRCVEPETSVSLDFRESAQAELRLPLRNTSSRPAPALC